MEKAVSGFHTSGIYPLNPDKFNEDDFAPANQIKSFTLEGSFDADVLTSPRPNSDVMPEAQTHASIDYLDPQPSTSKDNSFSTFAPLPKKPVKANENKRKSRKKLSSKILTSTPIKEELEKVEEKRKLREKKK